MALDAQEIVLIDVRTPPEYIMEHIDGALLMPMAFFRPRRCPRRDGKRIVLHCGSGARSGKMAEIALESRTVATRAIWRAASAHGSRPVCHTPAPIWPRVRLRR